MSSATTVTLLIGLATALAMGVTIEVGWAQLRQRQVARPWLVAAAAAVALVPLGAAVAQLLGAPLAVTLASIWWPAVAMWVVGFVLGRRYPTGVRAEDPDAPMFERINAAGRHFEVGDLDAAEAALRAARARARPETAAYADLWLRLVDEERRRRDGARISSAPTRDAIDMEMTRIRSRRARPSAGRTLLVLAAGVAVAIGVPPAFGRSMPTPATACEDAAVILAAAEAAPRATAIQDAALSHLTLTRPVGAAATIVDTGLNLTAAARSRHDPDARAKLVAAGFIDGYARTWVGERVLQMHAEIFRFETAAGAAGFHHVATEYACRFANLAFAGPNGETGLQVRYSTGDPIVEQLAWVDGSMRIVVSRGFDEPPPDHGLIIDLARQAAERLATPQPAGSPIVSR